MPRVDVQLSTTFTSKPEIQVSGFSTPVNNGSLAANYVDSNAAWGTSAATLRDTPGAIRDYFRGVPSSQMIVKIGDSRVRVYGDLAVATGHYTFVDRRDGKEVARPARYSFAWRLRGGRWLIVDHHSSAVPAGR